MTNLENSLHKMNEDKISEGKIDLRPAGRDFIMKQLLNYKRKRVYVIILVLICISLLPIIASIINGTFINKSLKVDAIWDIGYHVQFLLLLPFFTFFVRKYFEKLEDAILILDKTRVIKMNNLEYNEAVDYSNKLFSHWAITFIPYIISLLMTIFTTTNYIFAGHNTWNSAISLKDVAITDILSILPMLPLFYILPAIILRIILTYFVIKKFLSGQVDIQPLHPDNCGGLSPLGDFSLRNSYVGIGVGIPVVILVLFNIYKTDFPISNIYNIMNISTYIISLTIIFFLPLLGARGSMLLAKNLEKKRISDYYQEEKEIIYLGIDKKLPLKDLELSKLEGLMKLYETAKSMPVYPFDTRNVVRFFFSILWPIILLIIGAIIEKI